MNRRVFVLFAALLIPALPAFAYKYIYDCRGKVTWPTNGTVFEPSLTSFPIGSPWHDAVEAMRTIWNTETPGTKYAIYYSWVPGGTAGSGDGRNSILIPAVWNWLDTDLAVSTVLKTACNWWPGARSQLKEADIYFNPNVTWEHSLNPALPLSSSGAINSIIVGVHEHGHAYGLDHSNTQLATLNTTYPDGGVLGNDNEIQPHADDTEGNRAGYGILGGPHDFAASAFRPTGDGTSAEIGAPAWAHRGASLNFPFTVENRSPYNASVIVGFYLSPDRYITTADQYLGSVNLSINRGTTATLTSSVNIDAFAPTGPQFLGWVMDPWNAFGETDEGNNAVGLVSPTNILVNRAPSGCFTFSPNNGPAPQVVFFDASCSSDLDGDSLIYFWDFGDGTTGSGSHLTHLYEQAGSYYVSLTVEDSSGAFAYYGDFVSVSLN